MNLASLLWRLISTDEVGRFGDDLTKLEHDGDPLAKDVQAWLLDGVKIVADAKRINADLGPLTAMLQQLK
jgi:hypothetical protein